MEKRLHNADVMRSVLREKKLLYHYCAFLQELYKNVQLFDPFRVIVKGVC